MCLFKCITGLVFENPFGSEHVKQPNLKSYLSWIYFDMSLEGSIKENIDELIYEAIETIRGKKHKTPNEFSICNYLNVNTDKGKDFIECRIRYLLENGKIKKQAKKQS